MEADSTIDYKFLLEKYMSVVFFMESVVYVDQCELKADARPVRFSAPELAELKRLELAITGENFAW